MEALGELSKKELWSARNLNKLNYDSPQSSIERLDQIGISI